jgi:hypothetical protein
MYIARFVSCLTAAAALWAGPQEPGIRVEASWPTLPDAAALVSLKSPVIPIDLRNNESFEVRLSVEAVYDRDGQSVATAPLRVILGPREQKRLVLNIPVGSLNLADLQYSGRMLVQIAATSEGRRLPDSLTMPPLYFHSGKEAILVYRKHSLQEMYAGGNFRQFPINTSYGSAEAARALLQARVPGARVEIARVGAGRTVPGPTFGVQGIRFCFAMPGSAYVDSSRGEDLGTMGDTIPMRRNWVALSQGGNPLFSGFLDAQGCTPSLPAAPNAATLLAWSPIYLHSGHNIRGFLSDLNLGAQWPATMPLFFINFNSGNTASVTVLADEDEYAQTIFAAATQGIERYPGGHTDALYEWQIREQGDNTGTGTTYAPEGHPRVNVKYSLAALNKFTIVHEYGHAVLIGKLNPPLSESDLDYTVTEDEANQHSINSKEWQLAAAIEGFGHFVSGVAWNDVYPNADGIFYSFATHDLDTFGKYFENNWNPATYPGQGVELDWAQFFWNYYTDVPAIAGVPFPTQSTLLAIWLGAHPWPVNEGFFETFSGSASALLGAMLPPAIPGHLWFTTVAGQAGVDH